VAATELQWRDAASLEAAQAWARATLSRLGRPVEGEIEQVHVVPWSTVLRVPTADGPVWMKAQIEALAHEAGVAEALAVLRPDVVPALLARDPATGWMLLADAGERLRERIAGDPTQRAWLDVLPLYAGLQRDSATIHAELLAAGAPDLGAAGQPLALAALMEDGPALQPDHEEALTADELARLPALHARVVDAHEALVALGLPETIQHDDLHDGQVFVRDGGYVVIDWGDACVSCPLLTLVVTLRVLALRLGVEPGARELEPFRDAYLEAWSDLAPRSELVAALPQVELVGRVNRALTWWRIVPGLPPELQRAQADAVPDWLRYALELM
jgi:hypothetical protein